MPLHPEPSVSVSNLTKRYGAAEAVRGVSLELFPGEIYGLLGQNGAGKTTTIECILGLRSLDAGTIAIQGVDVVPEPLRARQSMGAQLQSDALQPKVTPREALELFASFYKKPDKIDKVLAQFGLTDKACAPFDSLSGGQQQRLFLALALIHDPQILLLDEPTAGLDPQSRRELHQCIVGLKAAGKTILLSTHNIEEAASLCDRIGILHEGRIIVSATPAALVASARSRPRVLFRTARPLGLERVIALPAAADVTTGEAGWQVGTDDLNRFMGGLVHEMDATGNGILDLRIQRPTLEDVFIELTGRAWFDDREEDEKS